MAFPTTGILDDFSPDDAAPMTGWADLANGISASGGEGVVSVSGAANVSYWNTLYGPIQTTGAEVYYTIGTKTANGNTFALYLMTNPAGGTGYALYITPAAGTDAWELYRLVTGTPTLIASPTQEISTGDSIGLEIIGTGANNCKVYYKASGGSWTVLSQVQDTGVSGSVYPQFGIISSGGVDGSITELGGGTVVAASQSVVPVLMAQFKSRRQ